jgi:hypothetical protein
MIAPKKPKHAMRSMGYGVETPNDLIVCESLKAARDVLKDCVEDGYEDARIFKLWGEDVTGGGK